MMLQEDRTHESDAELVAAWKAGDARAGSRLLTHYVRQLDRYFYTRVGEGSAQDLRQDTLVRLDRAIHRFHGKSSFRTYLFAVARNTLLDHLRAKIRRGRLDTDQRAISEVYGPLGAHAGLDSDCNELLAALRKLAIDEQELIELHCVQGFSFAEIAEMRPAPSLVTLRTQLCAAKKKLVQLLGRSIVRLGGVNHAPVLPDRSIETRLRHLDDSIALYLLKRDGVEPDRARPRLFAAQPS